MAKKKSGGLFTLLTGMVLGAGALFFSKKENRVKAKKTAKKATVKAKKFKKNWDENPQKVIKSAKATAKRVANRTVKRVEKALNKKIANLRKNKFFTIEQLFFLAKF